MQKCHILQAEVMEEIIGGCCGKRGTSSNRVLQYSLGHQEIGVRFSDVTRSLSVSHSVQTGSGAHPVSHPFSTGEGTRHWTSSGWGVNLTIHIHIVPRLRSSGAITSIASPSF
jgi:altronate dehydratase